MQRNFTPIIWAYQSFKGTRQDGDLFDMNNLLKPNKYLTKILDELEKKMPEIPDDVLRKILEKTR